MLVLMGRVGDWGDGMRICRDTNKERPTKRLEFASTRNANIHEYKEKNIGKSTRILKKKKYGLAK
jgi:hypothetical protein